MKRDLFVYTKWLSIVGIFLALYLFYEYITVPEVSPCYISSYINCEASTKGPLAETLGIPTALYGLIGYSFILLGSIKKWKRVILGMATFGLLFCLRITFLELFVIKQICPVCMACQIVMMTLFGFGWKLLRTSKTTS